MDAMERAKKRVLGAGRIDPDLRDRLSEGMISKSEASELRDKLASTEELCHRVETALDNVRKREEHGLTGRVLDQSRRMDAMAAEMVLNSRRQSHSMFSLRLGLIVIGVSQLGFAIATLLG